MISSFLNFRETYGKEAAEWAALAVEYVRMAKYGKAMEMAYTAAEAALGGDTEWSEIEAMAMSIIGRTPERVDRTTEEKDMTGYG